MKKIFYTTLCTLFVLAANAQAPALVFLQADANVDCYEFLVLRRTNLNTLSIRDAGICSDDKFRTNENDILSFTGPSFTDVPAGTIIQVKNAAGPQDSATFDGRVLLVDNLALNNTSTNPPGDQVIAYTGAPIGSLNCAGAAGTNTFVSGFDWGNSGWTSGASSSNDSKAPGTPYDFAFPGAFNKVQYTGSIIGNEAALVSNINNTGNWTGTATGDGIFSLKNILFDESNYTSGTAVVTPSSNSVTLNLSSLVFSNTTTSTRYAVIIVLGSAPISFPVDRYTCYTGIVPNVAGAPSVASLVAGQTADNFCGVIAQGNGQVVYLDYTLPASLTINGLTQNANYQYAVVAVNGNGYTANFSSTAYTGSFSTGTPVNTVVEFASVASTVNENVGTVAVNLTITNPSPSTATTVEVAITGGSGDATDINNYTTQTVTFPANTSANQTVTITVTDDILVEGTETVIFSLQNISGGQTATIGTNNSYTLTITDNDSPLPDTEVHFTTTPTTPVSENVGTVSAVLSINNPSPSAATTVEVQIIGGTGIVADIANYTTQTITFPAGSSANQTLTVTVTDDAIFENTETIDFAIRNIAGGQGTPTIIADSTFTLTIIDNDIPNLVINEIHYNPAESAGSPDIDYEFVELYNAEPIAVDLSGYTFSQGINYTFPNGTTIDAAEYIIVAVNAATYSGQGYDVYQWAGGDLDNVGETIEVRTQGNLLVDVVTYGSTAPWPTAPNNSGPSLQLIATNLDNALAQNWYGSGPKNGTPGNVNSPVGIEEELASQINIYGYSNQLFVKIANEYVGNYTLNLLDMTGRNMGTFANLSGNQSIILPELSNGIYIAQFVSKNGEFVNKKLLLTR